MTTSSNISTIQLIEALNALYGPTDKETKRKANEWLQEFQKSPEAWSTANDVLLKDDTQLEVRMFAAQTFRNKIVYDLAQLDENARISLRDTILHFLTHQRNLSMAIITQLCLCLASLALQMPEWKQVYQHLSQLFNNDTNGAHTLLEFLTILPEEVAGNTKIPLSEEDFTSRSKELLADNAISVLQLLTMLSQSSGSDLKMQERVFKCLNSWLQTGDVSVIQLSKTPLFDLAFEALNVDDLFEVAVDAVCQIIKETKELEENMSVINMIYPKLQPLRQRMLQQQLKDEDEIRGICRIFTDAGETYVSLIVDHFTAFENILEGLVDCMTCNDLDIVKMTFNFWYALASMLIRDNYSAIKSQFTNIYFRVETIIIQHLHYPQDLDNWSAAERDEFRSFRHDMGDVIKDCCTVLGTETALRIPLNLLMELLDRSGASWQQIEAPLFSFRALGAMVDDYENVVMPEIMGLLQRLPEHPKIKYAATLVLGRYTRWTNEHPAFLQWQLTYLSSGFLDAEVVAASAMALKYLCKDCNKLMIPFMGQLHNFYCTYAPSLAKEDLVEISEALVHIVSVVPSNEMLSLFRSFCLPTAQKLHFLASEGAGANVQEIADHLDLLVVFLCNLRVEVIEPNQTHPVVEIVSDLMPIFDQLLTCHASNAIVSESLCKCYKACIVTFDVHFYPYVPGLLERLGAAFAKTHSGSYLWVARHCMRIHSNNEEKSKVFLAFLEALSQVFFEIIQNNKLDNVSDAIEEYFLLILTFEHTQPHMFVTSSIYTGVLQCSVICLNVAHPYAAHAVLDLMRDTLTLGLNSSPVSEMALIPIKQQGAMLLGHVFQAMKSTLHMDLIQNASVIVELISQLFPNEAAEWVKQITEMMFSSSNLPIPILEKYVRNYQYSVKKQNWNRIRRITHDLIASYRRRNRREV